MLPLQKSTSRQTENSALDDRTISAPAQLRSLGRLLAMMVATVMIVLALSPAAVADIDTCPTGTLGSGPPLGQQGPDLVIGPGNTCKVDGSSKTYNFHNVYIFGDATQMKTATLMFSDATMDFYAASILVQNMGVLQAMGIGFSGSHTNILTFHIYGQASDPGVTCKKLDSNKNVVDDVTCGVPDGSNGSSPVWGSNMMNMRYPTTPCTKTSQLDPPTLLPGGVDDCFYQYGQFDGNDLPNAYFGRKVLALSYGGTINLSGYKGAQGGDDMHPEVTGSSWMRLNATLKGNGSEQSLQVSGMPSDWQQNDYIVVTSTDYLPGHAEQLQVSSVSGSTVNLVAPVMIPHWGQTYSLANVPCNPQAGSSACDLWS
jgi:hypothetical protein